MIIKSWDINVFLTVKVSESFNICNFKEQIYMEGVYWKCLCPFSLFSTVYSQVNWIESATSATRILEGIQNILIFWKPKHYVAVTTLLEKCSSMKKVNILLNNKFYYMYAWVCVFICSASFEEMWLQQASSYVSSWENYLLGVKILQHR